jgi:hypothetical protein
VIWRSAIAACPASGVLHLRPLKASWPKWRRIRIARRRRGRIRLQAENADSFATRQRQAGAREEREYTVTPLKGIKKELTRFVGKYESKGRVTEYDKPVFCTKAPISMAKS